MSKEEAALESSDEEEQNGKVDNKAMFLSKIVLDKLKN